MNIISDEEAYSSLFDLFVYSGTRGLVDYWQSGLDVLPRTVIRGLCAFAQSHPEPRLFRPLPTEDRARRKAEEAALAVQAQLHQRLQKP